MVGLKPTYGRVSVRGVIPLSLSLDHVGPIARTVADATVMLQVIAGYDAKDANSGNIPVGDYLASIRDEARPARIGVPRKFFYEDLDPEVASAVEHALGVIGGISGGLRDIELAVPTDRTLQSAESYAYHAEFVARTPELYQPETLRRIRTGENISQAECEQRRRELEPRAHDTYSCRCGFTGDSDDAGSCALIAELKQNPDLLRPRELLLLRNTRPVNVWGLPAISVPCGFTPQVFPSDCRSSARTGEKTGFCRLRTPMSRPRPGTAATQRRDAGDWRGLWVTSRQSSSAIYP